jgi:hypothetical protein
MCYSGRLLLLLHCQAIEMTKNIWNSHFITNISFEDLLAINLYFPDVWQTRVDHLIDVMVLFISFSVGGCDWLFVIPIEELWKRLTTPYLRKDVTLWRTILQCPALGFVP